MVVVVFAVLTILTQQRLDNTLHNLNDGFSDLGNAFDAIDAQTATLDDIGERMLAVSQQISCVDDAFEAVIEGAARAFADAAADAAAIAYAAAGDANKLGSRIRGKDRWLDGALLVLLTMVLLVLPCAAYGALAKSPKVLGGAAARWGCVVVACLSVLLAFEFGVLVKVSDFCVAPDASFTALVDERFTISPEYAPLVDYYVTCGGANPLLAPLNESLTEIAFLDDLAEQAAATGACAPASALDELRVLMAEADSRLGATQTAAACDAVTPIYQDLVHVTLCRKFVRSLNAMAVSHAVVGVALYVFLYAANYVSETILLDLERRDLKATRTFTDTGPPSSHSHDETKEEVSSPLVSRPSQQYFSGWSVGEGSVA